MAAQLALDEVHPGQFGRPGSPVVCGWLVRGHLIGRHVVWQFVVMPGRF